MSHRVRARPDVGGADAEDREARILAHRDRIDRAK